MQRKKCFGGMVGQSGMDGECWMINLHSSFGRHCGGVGVFELGREAKKSPGGLRLLKKTRCQWRLCEGER